MKFGGASLADGKLFSRACDIIQNSLAEKPIVVVSAMMGVTDILVDWLDKAVITGNDDLDSPFEDLKKLHENAIWEVVDKPEIRTKVIFHVNRGLLRLERMLSSIACLRECSKRTRDHILAFGERFSTHILAAALACRDIGVSQVDGEDIIVTDENYGLSTPVFDESCKKIKTLINKLTGENRIAVIMGFVGASKNGTTTTLGRGGTDLTASLVANCMDATELIFYKEVDGVMSADPKYVTDSKLISALTYREVSELSFFGAKILHPVAIRPLREKGIPVSIRNFLTPDVVGTKIVESVEARAHIAQAISSLSKVSVITIAGGGLLGNPSIAGRVFSIVADAGKEILMISQSSSEQNISFAVRTEESETCMTLLNTGLELDMHKGYVDDIRCKKGLSIVSVVGQRLVGDIACFGSVLASLAEQGVKVHLVANGLADINMSFVVSTEALQDIIRHLHTLLNMGTEKHE
jgi:aspartate kinase